MVPTLFFKHRWFTDCETYAAQRPVNQNCTNQRPVIANGNGDPHFKTMDGVRYTLNSKGEFILLRNLQKTLNVQVRTEV